MTFVHKLCQTVRHWIVLCPQPAILVILGSVNYCQRCSSYLVQQYIHDHIKRQQIASPEKASTFSSDKVIDSLFIITAKESTQKDFYVKYFS